MSHKTRPWVNLPTEPGVGAGWDLKLRPSGYEHDEAGDPPFGGMTVAEIRRKAEATIRCQRGDLLE